MKYLLDTCALIDAIFTPEKLSVTAKTILENPKNKLVINVVSLWEIMIKEQLGKLSVGSTSAREIQSICDDYQISITPILIEQLDLVRTLDRMNNHGDPFDRLIISQAITENLPVITSDRKFSMYPITVIW